MNTHRILVLEPFVAGQLLAEAIDQTDEDEGDEEDGEFHGWLLVECYSEMQLSDR